MLTQERLKEVLDYDPETGVFRWKIAKSNFVKTGNIAGTNHPNGYRYIKINSKKYLSHRLAWFYIYGSWPEKDIDHVNRIKDDNRIVNLR